ncbi:MAG: xanthine dehydrogenase family protein subunit M [Thermoflavifilum sp.]|nr:xanthine dehydrogenase family protein subunit M [Thermoflavifilum sp.]MCL6514573.1 xanthine dehydrogenase family protein subunit M [Alicyclobacillus sp.]
MIPSAFAYERVQTVEQAVRALQANPGAKLLAGGHSLIPLMKMRLATPTRLVDISGIRELRGVWKKDDRLVIGALTTHREIATDRVVRTHLPALAEAASRVGDLQVRNRGTIGGNLAHADPSSDLPAVALAFDAVFDVLGPEGMQTVPIDGYFLGPLVTALPENSVITAVSLKLPPSGTRSTYVKYPHPASGYAVVGVAAAARVEPDGVIDFVRVAVTGAGDVPYRAQAVEDALLGQHVSDDLIREAAAHAADDGSISGDLFASEAYRRHLCSVYVERALRKVLSRG